MSTTLETFGNIGDFLGGIGVFITLLYLALQVRQNTVALQSASRQGLVEAYRAWNRLRLDPSTASIFYRSLTSFPEMPFEERNVFDAMMGDQVLFFQSALALHESGHLPEENYRPYLDHTASFMATPGGAVWWRGAVPALPADMVRAVENRLSRGDLPDPRQGAGVRLDDQPSAQESAAADSA